MSRPRPQCTLARSIRVDGTGLHTGVGVRTYLHPAPEGHGIRFFRSDHPTTESVPAMVSRVIDSRLATTIGHENWRISTIEHMLSALWGLRIDNVLVELDADELPILDGSARPWVEAIDRVGVRNQSAPKKILKIVEEIEIFDSDRWVRLRPHEGFGIRASIEFDHASVGRQTLDLEITPEAYRTEISWARTFGFMADIEGLRRLGLIRGGSLENAVVFGPDGVLNPEGLRAEDEPVRHKILDMIGDLSLIGSPIQGLFEAERPGHALTRSLVEEVMKRPAAWCWN